MAQLAGSRVNVGFREFASVRAQLAAPPFFQNTVGKQGVGVAVPKLQSPPDAGTTPRRHARGRVLPFLCHVVV